MFLKIDIKKLPTDIMNKVKVDGKQLMYNVFHYTVRLKKKKKPATLLVNHNYKTVQSINLHFKCLWFVLFLFVCFCFVAFLIFVPM